MDDRMRYINVLREQDTFAQSAPHTLSALIDVCEARWLPIGSALWAAGHKGDSAFILIEGRIECTVKQVPDGYHTEHYTQPGTLLSLSSLVHPWVHTSSATPLDRSEVLCLHRSAFENLFEQQHPVAFHLIDAIAEQLVLEMRQTNERIQGVFGRPAETLRLLRRRVRED